MTGNRLRLTLAAAFALAGGCTSVPAQVAPTPLPADARDRETRFQTEGALARLRDQDLRVATVTFRIAAANRELCPQTVANGGFLVQHLNQFGAEVRPYAKAFHGLDDRPAVLAVIPGGPADRAGLRAGDALLEIAGRPFAAAPPAGATGRYTEVEAAQALIAAALATGPAELSVSRAGQPLRLTIAPVATCAYDSQLTPSREMEASADGRRVFLTTGMVRYTVTDAELAVVIGHEYAHNILRHQARIAAGGLGGRVLGSLGTDPASLKAMEREADYLGLYLIARAGYPVEGAAAFWRQFGADYAEARYAVWSHPGSFERAMALTAAADEIRAKQARGEPLTPSPVSR